MKFSLRSLSRFLILASMPILIDLVNVNPVTNMMGALARGTAGSTVLWSPDGRQLVYSDNHYSGTNIFAVDADGTNPRNLSISPSTRDFNPAWSPDSVFVAFTSFTNTGTGGTYIVVVNPDRVETSRAFQVDDTDGLLEPAWSPDSTRIGLRSNIGSNAMHAQVGGNNVIINVNTGELTPFVTNRADARFIAWSPDGDYIAFDSHDAGASPELWVVNTENHAITQVTEHNDTVLFQGWSPDGRRLTVWSEREDDWTLQIFTVDTHDLVTIGSTSEYPLPAMWSSDGTTIAFTLPNAGNGDIYLADMDGTHVRNITNSTEDELFLAWSPDGSQIAYMANADFVYRYDVRVMDRDGENRRTLTGQTNGWSDVSATDAAWSREGESIAIEAYASEQSTVYLVTLEDGNLGYFDFGGLLNTSYAFSPDWSHIAYTTGEPGLVVVEPASFAAFGDRD